MGLKECSSKERYNSECLFFTPLCHIYMREGCEIQAFSILKVLFSMKYKHWSYIKAHIDQCILCALKIMYVKFHHNTASLSI